LRKLARLGFFEKTVFCASPQTNSHLYLVALPNH
jgi:hypothetical protein